MEINGSVKSIVARNLSDLRMKNGMTQLQLAEALSYSDKAVSNGNAENPFPTSKF